MRRYFAFDERGTGYRQEIVAGITTFVAMAYIIVVNPAILAAAGIPVGPSMTATVLTAVFGTVMLGLWANRPFAIAPYMGENAFIAYTVVKVMGFSWEVALGAIFLGGVLFTITTVLRIRSWMISAIPISLKYSFSVGIGLFLAFLGLNETGIVVLGVPGAPVRLGDMTRPEVLLAVAGFSVTAWLMIRKTPGAIVIGLILTMALSCLSGVTALPQQIFSLPFDPTPVLGHLDIAGALSLKALPVVLVVFVMVFVDTVGTLIGVSNRAGLLDDRGNLPGIERPMLADAVSNLVAPVLGTTTSGVYIESAAGIEAGGRTGFTALVIAALFLLALILTPVLTVVPPHVYGIALFVVGSMMIAPVVKLEFHDLTEFLPAFLTITLTVFTYNIGVGITAGLLSYPVLKVLAGRWREVAAPMWVLAGMSLMFYGVYPYPHD